MDRAARTNPDRLVHDREIAVRRARVVDEPREVAADVRVAAPGAVDAEDPDAAVLEIAFLTRFAFDAVSDQFAGVIDDPRVFVDGFGREHAVAVNR